MIRGLILVNSYSKLNSQHHQILRLKEEFIALGVQIEILTTENFPAWVDTDCKCELKNIYDFVLYLDKDKYISKIIENSGVKLFDNAEGIEICDDKMLTHIALSNKGIKMPKTIPGLLCYTPKASISLDFIDRVEKELHYPLVMKESYGSLGKAVYLINNRDELIKKSNELICVPHLYQEFIKSSFGVDIRVIVIDGKASAWMKRHSVTDFRSNIEQGGHGEKCVLPPAFQQISEKVARSLNLDYCGIDLLIGPNGEPIVCEVNSNAFFNAMEEVTGLNVAKAYAEYIIRKISD